MSTVGTLLRKVSTWRLMKVRLSTMALIVKLQTEYGVKSSFLQKLTICFVNPFWREQEVSFYTIFFAYVDFFQNDEQRLRFLSRLQTLWYGQSNYQESFLIRYYSAERERFTDAYSKALTVFSSVRLTTPLEATASFVSKSYPKLSVS